MFDYYHLAVLGVQYPLNYYLSNSSSITKKSEKKFDYVRYNPRKNIDRWGLSLTSLDGGMSGIPDLDSLKEYNRDNNTTYEETDFKIPTEAYYDFKEILDPFSPWLFRTHVLKLNPGGFFPPHRDNYGLSSFRLIVPLHNIQPFIVEKQILEWELGRLYFLDTVKMHYLFNASMDPSYWLVLNVECNKDSVEKVLLNLFSG